MSKLLQKYFAEDFFIIPLRKNDKRPLFKKCYEHRLSYMETKQYLKEGYNIGVVAKDLWILDFDERIRDSVPFNINTYRDYGTWVQFTPRGYHVFYRGDYLKGTHEPPPNTVRHNNMHVAIAPSKINGKSYWWLDDCKGEILRL